MNYKGIELDWLQIYGHDFSFEDKNNEHEDNTEYYYYKSVYEVMSHRTKCRNYNINDRKYGDIILFFTCKNCNYSFSSVNEIQELDDLMSCDEMIIKNIIE